MSAPHIPLEQRVFGQLILDQVERSASRPYLGFGERRWSYAEFFAESQALARGLKHAGVRSQEPVILLMNNRPEFMLAYWALSFLNAIIVPVNTALKGDPLAYILQDNGARTILADADLVPHLNELGTEPLARVELLVVVGEPRVADRQKAGAADGKPAARPPRIASYAELVDAGSTGGIVCAPAHFDDVHIIPYTSGTTGPSKGVIVPYAQTVHTSLTCIDAVGMHRDDIIYAPLPLFHGMSRTMGTLPALLLGAQAHLAPRFSGSRFWQDVTRTGATVGVTIFTIPPTLKALPPSPLDRAHNLRVMFNAHHDREFEERFGVQLVEAHGMTELGLTVYSPHPERREGSAGRAAPDWEVRVVDEFGRDVATGEVGELVARPKLPSIMMKGYLNQPAQTCSAIRNLWFHSGDYMRQDNEGFFHFDGRKKERIRYRGENVSSYEVEGVVMQHPHVVECAVIAHPAGDGEDDIRLVAVLLENAGVDAGELASWLDERLPKFMRPRYIEFRAELPKTASGKIEKFRLMEIGLPDAHWDRLRAAVNSIPAVAQQVSEGIGS